MRDSRAICLFCRSRLVASAARRHQIPQWTERARLYTTATAAPTAQDVAVHTSECSPAVPRDDNGSATASTVPQPRADQTSTDLAKPLTSAKRIMKVRGARSLELFEEVLHSQEKGTVAPIWQPKVGMVVYKHLGKLGEIRKEHKGLVRPDGFNYFREHIYPELRKQNLRDLPVTFIRTSRFVLNDAAEGKMTDYTSSEWPTVAEITLMRRRLRLMEKPEHWVPMVVGLVDCIRNIGTVPEDYPSLEDYENSQAIRQSLLKDLIESWRMFCISDVQLRLERVLNSPTQFRLPNLNEKMLNGAVRQSNVSLGLATMFNHYTPHSLHNLPRAALPTFALLTDTTRCEDAIRRIAKELLTVMGRIFARFSLGETQVRRVLASDTGLSDYVWSRWQTLTQAAKVDNQAVNTFYSSPERTPKVLRVFQDPLATGVLRRLDQALHARDPSACEAVWTTFWGKEATPSSERAEKLLGMEEEFNFFIMVFTTLRQTGRAIEILGCMRLIGLPPTLKTWTSFIDGCKRASNAAAIHNIWERLVASRIDLDSAIWTARISGLIHAGEPEAGLRALNEMQKTWIKAVVAGRSEKAVQPTIQPVNAAIAGLLRLGSSSAAQKVLSWAGKHGIRPDATTFNTLLAPLVREGRETDISNLLEVMHKQEVQADAATFTILMDGALSRLDGADSLARVQIIESIISQMQSAGIEANIRTYGKMIHILLQDGDENEAAVARLLQYVWDSGRQLSPHIYTALAEHYFAKDPPDLEAVGRLVTNCTLHDRIFWERVVRGYAQVHDTANALACFKQIENSLSVTTSTLEDLLRALIAKEEWEKARELVVNVKHQRELGGGLPDPEGKFWKHRFWHLVRTHGLLDGYPAGATSSYH